ncbi:apolipoprotein N-acyltransferase [Inhella gelatinilytica]|uniref:Apolipoprotein N-acyltransferase n=1 Tax=Inhella gelatinilytica TaxID=2795030 RepID=A0A931ITL9_9BURK|nr:apolipoprotein N-acyltransferase [Inhella gelatinilytica]MBH9551291.1 apolipoprotein N-acyltransferase [Inhella gelatinilytica]
MALIAGGGQVLAFAPWGWWFVQPAALLALLLSLPPKASADGRPIRTAAWQGFWFGLGWFGSGLWWLYISLHDFGGLPPPLAGLALLGLFAFLALYPAGALALWVGLRPRLKPRWAAISFASCWLLGELARATWWTGFPWIATGYAHTAGLWSVWAPWIGVYGIGFLAAWMAAAGLDVRDRRWGLALWPLAVAVGGWGLPQEFTESQGTVSLTLLQPNVAQAQKFDPVWMDRQFDALLLQIEAAPTGVVITPESVLPVPLSLMTPEQQDRVARASQGRALLLGSFRGSYAEGWVNSLLGFQEGQAVYAYGKRHLLPFGEFIPPGFGWFVRALNIPMDDQETGRHQQPWVVGGQRLRPLICYEDLFGEDVVASALDGPDAATIWVNASNLAWFGPRVIQDQHLQFSQMRALEFQRPIVRSTNTGATAWVDHRGVIRARLPAEVSGQLSVTPEGRLGVTPYARWLATLGLAPLWAVALLPLGGVWRRRAKNPPGRPVARP